jgi:signal transduction histidine kinase
MEQEADFISERVPWYSGFLSNVFWQDINKETAESLDYNWTDRIALTMVLVHGAFIIVLVWLNVYAHLAEAWPSPISRRSLSSGVAFWSTCTALILCLITTYFYSTYRNSSHYIWRISLSFVLASFSCLLILVSGGSTLIHFHAFLVMTFIAMYADWRLPWFIFMVVSIFLFMFSFTHLDWVYYTGFLLMSPTFDVLILLAMASLMTILCQRYREAVLALQGAKRRNDEFLAIASHELKTPLTSLKGYTQVLQQQLKRLKDPVSLEYSSKIYHQLNRLTGLVRDLLDVSKIQSGKMDFRYERVGIDGLIRDVVEEVQELFPSYTIRIDGRAYTPILGDRVRLYQVLLNLLMNAVKYSPGKNTIIIHVVEARDKIVISVQDFGIGIRLKDQQKIFEPYFRANEAQRDELPGGLGMGLYICSVIVQLHHGRMWVDSEFGYGSTFSFYLPIVH